MIITKTVNLLTKKVKIEIELDPLDDYSGFDLFPDEKIPALMVAVGRKVEDSKKVNKFRRYFNVK